MEFAGDGGPGSGQRSPHLLLVRLAAVIQRRDPKRSPARIPPARWSLVRSGGVAAGFAAVALVLLVAAGWAAWLGLGLSQPLGVALALILLGLCVLTAYEAAAVWPRADTEQLMAPDAQTQQLKTISELINEAFQNHQRAWVVVYLLIMVAAGALSMHFTRQAGSQADWPLVGTAILVFVNGGLIAYWLRWLP